MNITEYSISLLAKGYKMLYIYSTVCSLFALKNLKGLLFAKENDNKVIEK